MATKERLIGADGLVEVATLGDTITTSGFLASGSWYVVTTAPSDGAFPGLTSHAGMLLKGVDAGTTLASGTGLIARKLSFNSDPLLDISSWSCEFSADEIEVTVLADEVKKYRRGKVDASGSMKGIVILGTTTSSSGILSRFLSRSIISSVGGASAISSVGDTSLYFRGILQKDRTSGEKYAFIFGQIELYNFSLGGDLGSAQEFDSKFRFINDDPVYVEELV